MAWRRRREEAEWRRLYLLRARRSFLWSSCMAGGWKKACGFGRGEDDPRNCLAMERREELRSDRLEGWS
jgi:hypothetical protein